MLRVDDRLNRAAVCLGGSFRCLNANLLLASFILYCRNGDT